MTSITFSSKPMGTLYKWALKRNRSIIIVYSVLLGLIGPVLNMYYTAYSYNYSGETVSDSLSIVTMAIFVAAAALFTLISAIKTFSFLHNKRSVDMYGAFPCSRSTLFVSHLLAGITSVSVPYLIFSIATIGISTREVETLKTNLNCVLFTLIMIIAAYTFTALMAYCCGTTVDTIITTLAVNVIWLGGIALFFAFMDDLIPGVEITSMLSTPLLVAFAPYGFGYMGMYAYEIGSKLVYAAMIIWSIIFTALVFFAALILSAKRKAECSQDGFAVKWLPMFIKAGASVIAGALFGYIFAASSSSGWGNMFAYVFWYIVIGLVAFFILHIIFARGLKKGSMVKSAVVYVCTTAVSIGLVFSMCFGMGMDTYVPSADSTKSASFGDYGSYYYYNSSLVESKDYTFNEPENIKTVTEIHQLIADNIRNDSAYGYPYYFGSDNQSYDYYNYTESYNDGDYTTAEAYDSTTNKSVLYPYVDNISFDFKYKSKLGKTTERSYYISAYDDNYDVKSINELVKKLVSTEEFKKNDHPIVFDKDIQNEHDIYGITVNSYIYNSYYSSSSYTSSGTARSEELSGEFIQGLYAALQKDILADDSYVPDFGYLYNCGYESFSKILGNDYWIITLNEKVDKNTAIPGYYDDYYSFSDGSKGYGYSDILVKSSYKNTRDYIASLKMDFSYESYNDDISSYEDTDSIYVIQEYLDSFATTGEYADFYNAVHSAQTSWAAITCENNDIDYNDWYEKYYSDYNAEITEKAREAYDDYQNSYRKQYGEDESSFYVPTEDEAYGMLYNIMYYAFDYVQSNIDEMNGTNSSTDSDKSKDSDVSSTSSDKTSDEGAASKAASSNSSSASSSSSITASREEASSSLSSKAAGTAA